MLDVRNHAFKWAKITDYIYLEHTPILISLELVGALHFAFFPSVERLLTFLNFSSNQPVAE